ncbi:acyltransferase [Priestia sp. D3YE.R1]|uniref:acyltransferase n=1 Tax=Priestia sp. D3YE.R1 TaxID=3400416 RepID=UPI003BA114A0
MWRTISYVLRVAYNIIHLPILSLLNGGRVKFSWVQKISPKAHLSLDKKGKIILSERCLLEEGTHVRAGKNSCIQFGEKVYFNRNCTITSHNSISIGDFTTVGPNTCIYDHDHDFRGNRGFISAPVKIGKNVWIGANVTILKGVTIGDNAVIGAGCVIRKNIPESTVAVMQNNLIIKEIKQ